MDVRFSITIRQHKSLRNLIEAIPDADWTPVPYWMDGAADVAQTTYTPFRTEPGAAPVRLIVRRVKPTPVPNWPSSPPTAITASSPTGTESGTGGRPPRHAEIENAIRDLKYGVGHGPHAVRPLRRQRRLAGGTGDGPVPLDGRGHFRSQPPRAGRQPARHAASEQTTQRWSIPGALGQEQAPSTDDVPARLKAPVRRGDLSPRPSPYPTYKVSPRRLKTDTGPRRSCPGRPSAGLRRTSQDTTGP